MGKSFPCSDQDGVKKGSWSQEEDELLQEYVNKNGPIKWQKLPKRAGLNRCGKSCRLRWINYLRPDIKRGPFSEEEEAIIISLHQTLGNKWSRIATALPGRTDNGIKNHWNTTIRKKLIKLGIDPETHQPISDLDRLRQLLSSSMNPSLSFHGNADFQFLQTLQNLLQVITSRTLPYFQAASQLNLNGLITNGENTDFTSGNISQPPTILTELGNFTPSTSNSLFLRAPGIPIFTETNHTSSSLVSPVESDSCFTKGLERNFFNMTPQPGALLPSNSLQFSEGELGPQGILGNNTMDYLPSLVSVPSESSMMTPTQAFESDFFDTLNNFLNDEASISFLKDIMG